MLGAIPFGLLLAKLLARKDVREIGSGNIGATNVARAAGRGAGLLTFALDGAKGALPTWLALQFFGLPAAALVGGAAFAGHVFPIYLRFRGGKGVATGAGVFAVLAPLAVALGLGAFAVAYALVRVVGVSSLAGLAAVGLGLAVSAPRSVLALYAAVAAVVIFRHRSNLRAFLQKARG